MVNANKFVIIGIEAFGMHTKAPALAISEQFSKSTCERRGD